LFFFTHLHSAVCLAAQGQLKSSTILRDAVFTASAPLIA
jgi:hypothetical protein